MKLPPRTLIKKMKAQHNRCFYCGEFLNSKFEIDHIIPFSKSKNGTVLNLCLSCVGCNRRKSDKTLDEFKRIISPDKLIRGMFYYEFINIYPHG